MWARSSSAFLSDVEGSEVPEARRCRRGGARHIQPLFTGFPGVNVTRDDTIRSFEELCDGKWDHLPESAFMYVGAIEEADAKAKKMAAAAA